MEKGKYEKLLLGKNIEKGETPQVVIPKGVWFAVELFNKSSFSLVGCSVSPGFNFDDFELGDEEKLLKEFPEHRNIIENFTHKSFKVK